jgi:hypothetical protein
MEDTEKPRTVKYKEIMNDWNYDASCTLTSLPVWDVENFKRLIFVVQSVQVASLASLLDGTCCVIWWWRVFWKLNIRQRLFFNIFLHIFVQVITLWRAVDNFFILYGENSTSVDFKIMQLQEGSSLEVSTNTFYNNNLL